MVEKNSILYTIPRRYYNGIELLNQMDQNGKRPGVFLSNSNRSAGKTTFFQIYVLEKFKTKGDLFVYVMREKNELEDIEHCFDYVMDNYFNGSLLSSKNYAGKNVRAIYFDGELCGYGICIKDAVKLKKLSSIFGKVKTGIMDEIQPDTGRFIREEIELFYSIIATVGRGEGHQSRYVEWILVGNNISVMNPYFISLGIIRKMPEKFDWNEKGCYYVKGNGWVCEFTFNTTAAKEMSENPALSAFNARNRSIMTTADFLINSKHFLVDKLPPKMTYGFTLKYHDKKYGVRRDKKTDHVYVTKTHDPSCKMVAAITGSDHDELTIQLERCTIYMKILRDAYYLGNMRFDDLEVKNDVIELLGVDLYK